MNEKEKQRRIGQIVLVCKIIKFENENLKKVPKIHVSDIERWLEVDEKYVATLINVCSSFDKRNIADDVLNSMYIYHDVDKRHYLWEGLGHIWKHYLDYLLENITKDDIETYSRVCFHESDKYNLSREFLYELMHRYVTELVFRIHKIAITDMTNLDAIMEIADLDMYSKEDYLTLWKLLLGMDENM